MLLNVGWKGGEYWMKSGVAAGAVAGLVGGIVMVIFGAIGVSMKLLGLPPGSMAEIVAADIILTVIFGAIFGAIFSKFHDSIPGAGVSKGFNFGLMIWLIKDIACSAYIGFVDKIIPIAVGLIFLGFFTWIAYGSLLGALCKK